MLVAVLLGAAVFGTWTARRSFPTTSGSIEVPGLAGDVEVLRDAQGVPTIVADTADDLFFAQGFVHAQDRFWEMDFRRHVTAGRLSELFGEGQLDTDRFVRTLGWRRVAEQEVDLLEDDTRAMLEAYADGVNAYLDGRSNAQLSFEHALLPLAGTRGYTPEPWTPADSVAWLKAMAWDLRSNLEAELERGRLATLDLGDGRDVADLFPTYPYDRHATILAGGTVVDGSFDPDASPGATSDLEVADGDAVADGEVDAATASVERALAATHAALAAAPQLLGDGTGDGIGSNSFAIGPERSATGTALLANDPHLGPSLPSIWYQVGLRCREVTEACPYHVAGFSFSGLPGIVIGQNRDLAWGFTNLGPDVADLFVEQLDADGTRELTEDGWQDLEVIEDTLRVAGGDDVPLTIRIGRHGPLLSDVDGGAADIAEASAASEASTVDDAEVGEHAVALRWVALDPVGTADAVTRFMRASDGEAFREAANRFEVPSQNLVWVETDGTIGYQAPGRIPVRRAGDGTVPVPGWTGEYGWDRFLDFAELPFVVDPPEGVIVTANEAVLPQDATPFLTVDPDLGDRGQRIRDLLGDRDDLTLDDLLEVQLDSQDPLAEDLVAHLVATTPAGGEDDEAAITTIQRLVAGWDGQNHADSAGAAAYQATWRHLLARTFHDELPEWAWPRGGSRWYEVVRGLLEEPEHPWWDDVTTEADEHRDDVLRAAMVDAHAELTDRLGNDPDGWAWGDLHLLHLTHQTLGSSGIGIVEELFNRGPLRTSGGTGIVNATGWQASEGYEVDWVPSMRYLVDAGDLDAGRWVHLTGQSGHPYHPHYTDQADTWNAGGTYPLPFSAEAVEAAAVDRLQLTPG
ncbi:penicillin acylase family protein [Nitriliruptoraceae bacterium ZYF776]|nr:penicillin acylase family protein [Profundirhabdus halotolerans]